MTLAEFMLARIAEDEAVARAADGNGWLLTAGSSKRTRHVARHSPSRVLAACTAHRQLVEEYGRYLALQKADNAWSVNRSFLSTLHWSMRYLALPYADHPDYREEWRP